MKVSNRDIIEIVPATDLPALADARALIQAHISAGTLATMHAAQALYKSFGFHEIAPYRAVEFGDTLFYELPLEAPAA